MFKKLIASCLIFTPLLLGACETYQSGDLPAISRLNIIKTGTHTKEQVLRILGTPSYEEPSENFVMYAKIRKKSRAFLEPKEFERDIYVFYFDKNDIVKSQKHLTLANANQVDFISDTTPTQHKELSITEQLIQNFGRYDAGGRDSTTR
ncbi:MAG: outer membrane protein assembly factor BamE [Alphaproteobacteria bacterium]|nr:outer membrane protein assembly factor BamE [Alphaproteobacteria bacterium]